MRSSYRKRAPARNPRQWQQGIEHYPWSVTQIAELLELGPVIRWLMVALGFLIFAVGVFLTGAFSMFESDNALLGTILLAAAGVILLITWLPRGRNPN